MLAPLRSAAIHPAFTPCSGTYLGFLQTRIDQGSRTNRYTWLNGNLEWHTNELGLATKRTWDNLNRLTSIWYPDGTTSYDNIGQLKTARGWEYGGGVARSQEQFGYDYDKVWNLNRRTNNALIQTFGVNTLNELTNATRSGTLTVAGVASEPGASLSSVSVSGTGLTTGNATLYADGSWAKTGASPFNGANTYSATATDTAGRTATDSITLNLPATNTFSYDYNGNLTNDGRRVFEYDFENQLTNVYVASGWRSAFLYDAFGRRKIRREFTWNGSSWIQTNEVRYVYDGRLVAQERDASNTPQVTYTRGNDLSASLQGAGGIGGLLARTDNGQMLAGDASAHAYYHCDGNGNITALVDTNGFLVARYNYDPYGNLLGMSGPLADANSYRFSSKEWCANSGLYYYGFRFYEPNLQRWLNSDPIGEWGGINLYGFVGNDPLNGLDALGLWNTCGHNSLLNSAFGKNESLQNDVKQWKDASKDMDDRKKGGQDPGNSYQHGMRAPDQDPSKARTDADKFIADQLQKAINAEQQGDHKKAMDELGRGMHTVADRSSPAHKGEQPWHGLKNPLFWPQAGIHALRELWPNRWQRQEVVDNLHDYYQQFQDGCNGGD